MRLFSILSATIILVLACADTLAREGVSRDSSANGPQHATGPTAITSMGSRHGDASMRPDSVHRATLNRSGSNRPAAVRTDGTRTAAVRLPLGAPQPSRVTRSDRTKSWLDLNANRPISTALTGLSIVLGAFLLLTWMVRKRLPKGTARLPDEIIEVLGRTTIAAKQTLHLVRVGSKLIVVSVTASGTETLTEITEAGEVARILAACQQHHVHSSTTAFRQVFEQLGREPAHGFLGPHDRARSSTGGTRAA